MSESNSSKLIKELDDQAGPNYWILKDGQPVRVKWTEWVAWFEVATESEELFLHGTEIPLKSGKRLKVSTVFLGLDNNHGTCPVPHIIETAIFREGGENGEGFECYVFSRCGDLEQAKHQHQMAVDAITDADHSDHERVARLLE